MHRLFGVSERNVQRFPVLVVAGINTVGVRYGGEIFWKVTTNLELLSELSTQVKETEETEDFQANIAILFSFIEIKNRDKTKKITAQVAIVANDNETYAIINYSRLDFAVVLHGISDAKCKKSTIKRVERENLLTGDRKNKPTYLVASRNCLVKGKCVTLEQSRQKTISSSRVRCVEILRSRKLEYLKGGK